nr:hypothetical protein [Anaerolineae bacterium]
MDDVQEGMVVEGKTPVVILGAGGYAALVHEILAQRQNLLIIGCTDKALGLSERSVGDGVSLRILGDDDILPELAARHPGLHAVLAIGPDLMDVRSRLIQTLKLAGIPPVAAVHQQAAVSQLARLAAGTIVGAGATISTGAALGEHCAVQINASIDHDARLGNNVFIGQGARISSYAELKDNVVIEIGASVNSRVLIGEHARVAGGAFVNTDVPDCAVVVGVPARVVRYIEA